MTTVTLRLCIGCYEMFVLTDWRDELCCACDGRNPVSPYEAPDGMTACVYHLADTSGEMLYVGLTESLKQRLASHERTKWWWNDVNTVTCRWYSSREEAAAAEKRAIKDYDPLCNKQHNRLRYCRRCDGPFHSDGDWMVLCYPCWKATHR